MTEYAPLTQIYGEVCESDELLPMGDVGVEFGYVLYQAAITVPAGEAAQLDAVTKTCSEPITCPKSSLQARQKASISSGSPCGSP